MTSPDAPSKRTTVRRGASRAVYAADEVRAILDSGMIVHVGVQTPDGPLVLPMAYGRDDDTLYLHGAAANHLLGTGSGYQVCATVTHVDSPSEVSISTRVIASVPWPWSRIRTL